MDLYFRQVDLLLGPGQRIFPSSVKEVRTNQLNSQQFNSYPIARWVLLKVFLFMSIFQEEQDTARQT